MNHYFEAIAIGAIASGVLFIAGVGAGSPTKAATPAESSAFYKARADLAKARWQFEFAVAHRAKIANRLAAHGGSRAELDASIAAVERAGAVVKADEAALAMAEAKLASTSGEPLPIS
jgi:hypothetical protein